MADVDSSRPFAISARCLLATSCACHLLMAVSKVRLFCCSRSSAVLPSTSPLIIWSRMFFCIHASEQKLHVSDSSRRDTRKLSNVSPGCCKGCQKFLHSTDLFMCPSKYRCSASNIDNTFPPLSSVRPRLSTIISVSCVKQRVS